MIKEYNNLLAQIRRNAKFSFLTCFAFAVSLLGCKSVEEKYGAVPMEIGAKGKQGQLLAAIRSGDVKTISGFIDSGVKPDDRIKIAYTWGDIVVHPNSERTNNTGSSAPSPPKVTWRNLRVHYRNPTLLEEAVRSDQLKAVELLIKQGVDVNLANSSNTSPLMYAALHSQKGIVQLLLHHGADVNAINSAGETALILAKRGGHKENIDLISTWEGINKNNWN